LQGADLVACETLLECAIRYVYTDCGYDGSTFCRGFQGEPYCYCSDQACSKGGDLQCARAFEAVAHSTDSAEVLKQLADPTTTLNRVAGLLEFTWCHSMCQGVLLRPTLGFLHGGQSFIVNEINHVQEGSDPGEFIEIFNGTGVPIDFTGKDLVGFADGKRVLTVPVGGVVPNGGYLVVGAAAVSVPAGVKKFDLPPGANVIPDTNFFGVALLPTGAPDPTNVTGAFGAEARPDAVAGGSQEGSACLIPNGVDPVNVGLAHHCAKATPGARNVQ
jgi:hypothetical protein